MRAVPDQIDDSEVLGRGIFSSKVANRARNGGAVHSRIFRERADERDISVDRLTYADKAILSAHHDASRAGQSFYGWATVTREQAVRSGRQVSADPLSNNPWHANINLPSASVVITEDEQQLHAVQLANLSQWEDRG